MFRKIKEIYECYRYNKQAKKIFRRQQREQLKQERRQKRIELKQTADRAAKMTGEFFELSWIPLILTALGGIGVPVCILGSVISLVLRKSVRLFLAAALVCIAVVCVCLFILSKNRNKVMQNNKKEQ